MIEHVLDALSRGLFVSACLPKTKVPATPHGFKDRTRNEGIARAMWAKYPDANIACNAGVDLDIDKGISSIEEARNFAALLGLPPTLAVRTGREPGFGAQFHFTGEAPRSGPFERNGVSGEVRSISSNLYGLWAGSVHPSGKKYEIVVDLPIAAWPAGIELGKPRLRASAPLASEIETTAWSACRTFERLLDEASHAKQGNRNASAHSLTWFSARAFLAGVFEIGFDEFHPALSERELKKLIGDAVRPLYAAGERDVPKMLHDSWRYGIRAGRLRLDIYWGDLDRLFAIENSEKIHRLLDGVTTDFPSATAARDYLVALLDQAGFAEEDAKRVLRYSQIDEAVAAQILADLKIAEILEGKDDGD